jgi:hypothetical protein
VKDLKRRLGDLGIDFSKCIERAELEELVLVSAVAPQADGSADTGATTFASMHASGPLQQGQLQQPQLLQSQPAHPSMDSRAHAMPVPVPVWATNMVIGVGEWLQSINPSLLVYKQPFEEYGYENTGMLEEEDEEGLNEAFDELQVKKPHRKILLKHFCVLKGNQKQQ